MAVAAVEPGRDGGLRFFLELVGADGTRRREPLAACLTARLEDALPVRAVPVGEGIRALSGFVVVIDCHGARGL
jgi:hypothetical protein